NENKVSGQDLDGELSKVTPFIRALNEFSKNIPQEKVYLHFDNTSYYQGDNIWFKCYVVTSGQHELSQLSKTLYVELLNPGGEIVDKRTLKIEDGQCHGNFTLGQLPFYSGFYEVRAYTKYMLNFGDDVIFSRLLPVFNKPKAEGDFEEKKMLGYGRYGPLGSYTMKREPPVREKAVNLRFFPEGGNLIQGVASRVAFEATDAAGNPIEVTGRVVDGNRQELCPINTLHEGKGIFTYTPGAPGRRKDIAEVEYAGRKYRFDMPAGLLQGVVMEVDNLSHPDSIEIVLRKNMDLPVEMYGVTIISGGKLQNYCFARMEDAEVSFKMDKSRLPAGVSQIVLFNSRGEIVCDRLIFAGKNDDRLNIAAKTGKPVYRPYESVDMELSVTDRNANPVNTTFSVSVRDGANEVENHHTILTDLLLMSEIKGYVRNPSYYFDPVETQCTASLHLDLLLMVQGWRRYSWNRMAGVKTDHNPSLQLKHLPEQGIETKGQILYSSLFGKPKPQPNVDVGLFLFDLGKDDEQGASAVSSFVTDEQGRFSFVSDVEGRWNMILAATEKGKAKNYQIALDRLFSPAPGRYRYVDLQVSIAEKTVAYENDEETFDDNPEDDMDSFLVTSQDSLSKLGIDKKIFNLPEVTVKARRTREQDIYRNRSESIAYYDAASEMDDIYDRGNFFVGNNIHEMLMNMNNDFSIRRSGDYEFLDYKSKMALYVVNYQIVTWSAFGYFIYKNVNLNAIKSIYINENTSIIAQYIHQPNSRGPSPRQIALGLSCVVFIETHPEGEIPVEAAKGIRKTWLEGYSPVKEFYSPDYSQLPPEPNDYRRTLYWNPMATTDENGIVKIQFYNNSSCTNFSISAETITPLGVIGVFFD
ncbi:MAG: hypothetical protein LBE79_07025, partial [Tannerella sp.]|nr:hypothetical protein [Tannerella sp.]